MSRAGQGTVSRRRFLALASTASLLALARPDRLLGLDSVPLRLDSEPRRLELDHCHTREKLSVTYCEAGCYLPEALERVDHFLRDFRTGEVHAIDPRLLDILHELGRATASKAPFQVISGYRSPTTNEMLRERGSGVASRSLHMSGKAIDVRLGDVPTRVLRDTALRLGRGGVGYYPGPDFVHVDTGRVRRW